MIDFRLSDEAAGVLKEFYLQLRKNTGADGTPITARQLESLVRLAEARAKLELREEITKQDAMVITLSILLVSASATMTALKSLE